MTRYLLALVVLLMAPVAQAQQSPLATQSGPDLIFSCGSSTGHVQVCRPTHPHYKRYMRLANWRFVGQASAPGSCILGHTYGYEGGVWVSGDCVGVFVAPDLRYGDAYNAERVRHEIRRIGGISH